MPPRRRNSSGYRGVRARPSGTFSAEIRSGEARLSLGTFETAHEAARAYDATAWALGRPRRSMNFDDARTREQAERLAPPPRLVSAEERRQQREQWERLVIAERDAEAMRQWAQQFPEDVAAERAFWDAQRATRVAARAEKRARKAAVDAQIGEENPALHWDDDDPRWEDMWLTSEYTTSDSDGFDWGD
ncbi:unnamed protein product [Alopecurus aequalis]